MREGQEELKVKINNIDKATAGDMKRMNKMVALLLEASMKMDPDD